MDNPEPTPVQPTVAQTKQWRKDLDHTLQAMKTGSSSDPQPEDDPFTVRFSRERSLAITKVQEAIMWLGMDLKAQREEGILSDPSPYPESYDPSSPTIEPTPDGLRM